MPPSTGIKYEFHHSFSVSSLIALLRYKIISGKIEKTKTPILENSIFSFLNMKSKDISRKQQAILITETNEKAVKKESKIKSLNTIRFVFTALKYKFKMNNNISAS